MNYAQKGLRGVVACIEKARATEQTLQQLAQALEMGEPVEITFRSAAATITVPCSPDMGNGLLAELIDKVQLRIGELEVHEVHWCKEVVLLAQEEKEKEQRREAAFSEAWKSTPPAA